MSRPLAGAAQRRSYPEVLREAIACIADRRAYGFRIAGGAHRVSADARMLQIVVASLPAVLVGLWSQGAALRGGGLFESILTGLSSFVPLLALALAVSLFWEVVFARVLDRPADAAWLMSAWLYAALLPPWVPSLVVILGLSVGVVFGSHIFGGTGRYLVSPALLGAAFINISYPSLFAAEIWQETFGELPAWVSVADGGVASLTASGANWTGVFLGAEVGPFGAPSALLCLLGAAWLAVRGIVSWRTLAGAMAGMFLSAALFGSGGDAGSGIPWYWHLASGSFAFGLAFIATDPTTMPLTKAARWMHGVLIGALIVTIRTAVPAHPEATLNTLLFAGLCIPLFDHVVVAASKRARHRRLGE
ncbi:MAG: RnfABCDGE type electron transport complex subunit D [Gammaproteobacteria bacterium]|jgi:Na+-transporting NADH:ubiquinone oxidoreductase subunit B